MKHPRPTAHRALALGALVATLGACRAAPTELVVWLDTDIPYGPTAELTAVRVSVDGPDGRHVLPPRQIDLGSDGVVALPVDLFAISPRDNDATRVVTVTVDAVHAGQVLFTYVARSSFLAGRRARVRVYLANCCRDPSRVAACGADQTCGAAGCEPRLRDPQGFDADAAAPALDATTCDVPLTCPAGATRCAATGPCVEPATDASNCGACGHACPGGSDAACVAGSCTLHCGAGLRDCDMNTANGCESTSATDPANCNGCGSPCPSRPHAAVATCVAGVCGMRCDEGYVDCDGVAANGCEADLANDANNCGACSTRCPQPPAGATNAGGVCVAGHCTTRCTNTEAINCDGEPANGCEVVAPSCVSPCGTPAGCFQVLGCSGALHATFHCNPTPPAVFCDTGFYDCDGDPYYDGCESTTPCAGDAGHD